ncbi:MAG: carbamoyltransferase [Acidobacteria bacterium]|nr:carbamoyltransferase [Acidobacteriota bacterium]
MPSTVLGVSAYYHDSAACLLVDGRIAAAAQEERFTRKKHDERFPSHAVAYCLKEAGLRIDQVDVIGFYEKPLVKFERLLESYIASAPRGLRSYLMAMPLWLGHKLWMADEIRRELGTDKRILFGDHHESHAASAFYPSPFEEAAILTIDGVGEWTTSSIGHGRGAEITMLREMRFPHSVGLLYSAFTYFTGFKVNEGEYKVMGLAPYGEPKYVQAIRDHIVDIHDDGSIRLNLEYFEFVHGLTMTGERFARLFGGPPRAPDGPVTQREMDLARSVQEIVEEVMLRMACSAQRETGSSRLCLAGGVALNCVGNGRLLRGGPFEDIWIQPAAGDAGGALGVAYALWHRYLGQPRVSAEVRGAWVPRVGPAKAGHHDSNVRGVRLQPDLGLLPYADEMQGALLGPRFSDEEIAAWLRTQGIAGERLSRAELPGVAAELLAAGKVIGLFQGRMEFGPRALGCRSIIADARSPVMQSVLNLKIKFRESFRPFAPAVLRERVAEWFEMDYESPYMLLVADVAGSRRVPVPPGTEQLFGIEKLKVPRSTVPAITHVDDSARIQTVRREDNPLYYDIIRAFDALTGCPVIVNTSFNVKDEPIVCTPEDAYHCFMKTQMDVLVLESYVIVKPAAAIDGVTTAAGAVRTTSAAAT